MAPWARTTRATRRSSRRVYARQTHGASPRSSTLHGIRLPPSSTPRINRHPTSLLRSWTSSIGPCLCQADLPSCVCVAGSRRCSRWRSRPAGRSRSRTSWMLSCLRNAASHRIAGIYAYASQQRPTTMTDVPGRWDQYAHMIRREHAARGGKARKAQSAPCTRSRAPPSSWTAEGCPT